MERGESRSMLRVRAAILISVSGLLLALAATVSAAQPKVGKLYVGVVSEPALNGFHAPVRFTVSRDGRSLTGFRYSTRGCFGIGGPLQAGHNYYLDADLLMKVGSIPVVRGGKFSVTGAKSTFVSGQIKQVTTSTVSGRFVQGGDAEGQITFRQHLDSPGSRPMNCGPRSVSFSAAPK